MSLEMRILTVRQPWAWAIIHGGKDIENRVRNIGGGYRGPIAIHVATQHESHLATDTIERIIGKRPDTMRDFLPIDGGRIIGVVDVVDVHRSSPVSGCEDSNARSHMRKSLCSVWAEPNVVHLVLANPRPLAEPIPYRGALGLRRLDDDTTARVLAQGGAAR